MVCVQEETGTAMCVVRDLIGSMTSPVEFYLPASTTVSELFKEVGRRFSYDDDQFDLVLQTTKDDGKIVLTDKKNQTVEMAGLSVEPGSRNRLAVLKLTSTEQRSSNSCYLRLGASASPTSTTSPSSSYDSMNVISLPPPSATTDNDLTSASRSSTSYRHETGYVGLVNQAMTCYLNSLLQALYMTPEFRSALYIWEYDYQSDESKSIPYQLQKLFLNLQTSQRSAVETTELTRSFGWDSSEAWQQHDIQELCRVMFDALEQNFKNTKQSDLINRLYEGKMIDYVKCLECSTEKTREDKFLDIPLPVRPFGSTVAYGCVEEALRAFVQPETLDGNNQYFCERCNKKCDAHKGLKFSKFPYLLTLHLKRFDFDYSTLHRIKLNDKVTFPETLNLNGLISAEGGEEIGVEVIQEETIVKCDDSSTTDSGSALDDEVCQSIDNINAPPATDNRTSDFQEDDEGIDVSHQQENEKNRQNCVEKSGPYMYELFSIMIHSGSATGGHYYAYIKDFKDNEWYCFNDQSVTRITHEDIKKSYGGGPVRGYYSGAYSSSTNAYMLMYRQIDSERNTSAMSEDEFPQHITLLHKKMEEEKELESRMKEKETVLFKAKVHCYHPTQNQLIDSKIYVYDDVTLKEATAEAYRKLNLENVVPIERCRLTSYDKLQGVIECSYDDKDDELIRDLFPNHVCDLLMDIRADNEEFEVYKPGSIRTKVMYVNLETEEMEGPISVRGNLNETVKEYKQNLAKVLKLDADCLYLVLEKYSNDHKLLQCDDKTLKCEGFYSSNKLYVSTAIDEEDPQKPFIISKLHKVIDRFEHIITLHIQLPEVDKETLERLNIPALDQCNSGNNTLQTTDNTTTGNSHSRGPSPNEREPSPQLSADVEDECTGAGGGGPSSDQSASEDSSLTDSDRTIVGDSPGDCLAQLSPCDSPVGSDHYSPEVESLDNKYYALMCLKEKQTVKYEENWDDGDAETSDAACREQNYYFKATPYTEDNTYHKMLKVLVDKRMFIGGLKLAIEQYVGVPVDHFRVFRTCKGQSESECTRMSERLNIHRDEERLIIKLGRALKKGELAGNVLMLSINDPEPVKLLFEWIIAKDAVVGQVKKEIIEEMNKRLNIELDYDKCRLRKKCWRNPSKCYLDDSKFEELKHGWDIFIQPLPAPEPVTNTNQMLLFIRQWCPATLELKHFDEIVLDNTTVAGCKEKISEVSGIPVDNIDIAKGQGTFPYTPTSVLTIHSDLDWNPTATDLHMWPLNIYDDGHVIIYRDNREKIKQLSNEEKKVMFSDKELTVRRRNYYSSQVGGERASSGGGGGSFTYSPRKERALKIYLDTAPPRRREEPDVD